MTDEVRSSRFTKVYLAGIDRLPGTRQSRVFWWMAREADRGNFINISVRELAHAMSIPLSTMYRDLMWLRKNDLLVSFTAEKKRNNSAVKSLRKTYMLDPSVVYSGDYKYHSSWISQFRVILEQQQKEFAARDTPKTESGDDNEQQSDVQP